MRLLLALLALTFLYLSAFAAEPFVGGALQYAVVFPHYGVTSLTRSGWLHDFGCWGSEFSAGLAWPEYSVYAAYGLGTSSIYHERYHWIPPNGQSQTSVVSTAWREKRWLAGARWHLNGRSSYPVKPTVGLGLSYGNSRLEWQEVQETTTERRILLQQTRRSDNFGVLLELGFLIRTGSPVDLLLLAQAHRYEADFGDDGMASTVDHYVVLMPAWQLGARWRIGGKH